MGRENKQVGTMANLLLPNFYVLPALSSQLSVFSKLCIVNTLLHFLLLFQLCRSLRNIPLDGRILGKSEVIITVGWVWWRHQRAPLFSLASGPPTLNPPLSSHMPQDANKRGWAVQTTRDTPKRSTKASVTKPNGLVYIARAAWIFLINLLHDTTVVMWWNDQNCAKVYVINIYFTLRCCQKFYCTSNAQNRVG